MDRLLARLSVQEPLVLQTDQRELVCLRLELPARLELLVRLVHRTGQRPVLQVQERLAHQMDRLRVQGLLVHQTDRPQGPKVLELLARQTDRLLAHRLSFQVRCQCRRRQEARFQWP